MRGAAGLADGVLAVAVVPLFLVVLAHCLDPELIWLAKVGFLTRSPIRLDLGARTPEEPSASIAAEPIQLRWGGTDHPLTATEGRIHLEFVG